MDLIASYWEEFQKANPEYAKANRPPSFYYCDNQPDADECAELVVKGIKRATSPSLWGLEKNQEPLPQVGDLAIVTNWVGTPKAIVRTVKVEIVAFREIAAEYAYHEGEGDRSLAYWKQVHWAYYTNEMAPFGEFPDEGMPIVCEYFERIG